MSAYIHGVLTTVATNVSWKCQINKRALIINASEYLDLTSFIPHFWILWSISQVYELRCRLETLLTVTQIHIIYTHLLYGRFVSSLRCIIMNYEVVHTCCSHASLLIWSQIESSKYVSSHLAWSHFTSIYSMQINNCIIGANGHNVFTQRQKWLNVEYFLNVQEVPKSERNKIFFHRHQVFLSFP